jgi:glycosyltransferase involved in cell wall biosynthesis
MLAYGDAIGHEALGIQRILQGAGWESEIFVEAVDPRLESLTRDYRDLVGSSHPDNLLLNHFSLGSKASRLAYALPDRMALVYHNITPPAYFVGVHESLVHDCFHGRRELRAYVDRCDLALGASPYSKDELDAIGFSHTGILPVVTDFSYLDHEPDWSTAREFDDGWTNILFVGRVAPNKKIDDLIRAFHAYHTLLNPRSRLLIVGSYAVFERYLSALYELAAHLGNAHVHFAGQVSDEELIGFYEIADLFLCASEHEGFCVPLVEAFYKEVPVLAYASTAVPSTMDGGGMLYTNKDPADVAALMDVILSNPGLQQHIVDGQLAALERLRSKDFRATLLRFVNQILSTPRAHQPAVDTSFWNEFDLAEQLEKLRLTRPAIYHALPVEPRRTG